VAIWGPCWHAPYRGDGGLRSAKTRDGSVPKVGADTRVGQRLETMATALKLALDDANLPAEAIGFVNAHGTATEWGDIAETQATQTVLGSLKGYFGHSLGACGGIEAWLGIEMMRDGCFMANANLEVVDERCGHLDYIMHKSRAIEIEYSMSNNFAFGGINTSIIFRRV
jgi:3-oxoacyl-[acyl-carrier-protein] synthase II